MMFYYITTTLIYILLIDNILAAQLFDLWSDYDPEEGELGRIQICKSSSKIISSSLQESQTWTTRNW